MSKNFMSGAKLTELLVVSRHGATAVGFFPSRSRRVETCHENPRWFVARDRAVSQTFLIGHLHPLALTGLRDWESI